MKAIVPTTEEWTIDSKGNLDEYNASFEADRYCKIAYYLCGSCSDEFKTWKEAKKHMC